MLSKERMYRILNLLKEQTFVTVKQLMDEFDVSRSSIMRDLIELENLGLIKRERGGAVAKDVANLTLSSFNEAPVIDNYTLKKNNVFVKKRLKELKMVIVFILILELRQFICCLILLINRLKS